MVDYIDKADNYHVGSVFISNVSVSAPYQNLTVSYSGSAFNIEVDNYIAGYGYTGHVAVSLQNECGLSGNSFIIPFEVVDAYYSSAYPNPVSDVLNIKIDADAYQKAEPAKDKSQKIASKETVYDIRLYDIYGNKKRQTNAKKGITKLDVSNLPADNYFLHIYDGNNKKPEVHTIIIKH
jgi:hypothetical protein